MSSPTVDVHKSKHQGVRQVTPLQGGPAKEYCSNEVINSRYTALNFLPKNLYEQFRRPLNMYFLIVSCLQFISIIAPVNPLSTLLPLLFAFSLTAAKEGYDDVKRHRQDAEYNARQFNVLRSGKWIAIASKDIRVGDVVEVQRHTEFPCDMVGLVAPDPVIFIRTENLDGEIDLKARDRLPVHVTAAPAVASQRSEAGHSAGGPGPHPAHDGGKHRPPTANEIVAKCSKIKLIYPPPSHTINSFDAKLEWIDPDTGAAVVYPLSSSHLLLQSSYLKNTPYVYGIAVYTGNETKCGMNKHDPPVKWCKLDQQVSTYSKVIFTFQLLVGLVFGVIGYEMSTQNLEGRWYASAGTPEPTASYIIYPLRFFLLTSVMIPVSFKFVVDMSKYFMALVLEWDLEMYDEERGLGMKVKNSGIVEDLARVEYVLSDKTGTLTQNVMTLMSCSLNGHRYTGLQTPSYVAAPDSESGRSAWRDFFTALAICNTVDVEGTAEEDNLCYMAPSPDEEALCRGAAGLGYRLLERTKDHLVVDVSGLRRKYAVLQVFAFTSERKCMSILLQESVDGHHSDHILMLTKGADDKVLSLLKDQLGSTEKGKNSLSHLKDFSSVGLRTLVFASKTLTLDEYRTFKEKYDAASVAMEKRKEAEEALQTELERGLTYLGVSAIEDKLQENVQKTLTGLIDANIRVWMLTGDKVETARQIALSCGLMDKEDKCQVISGPSWASTLVSMPIPKPPTRHTPPVNPHSFATVSSATASDAPPLLSYGIDTPRRSGSSAYGGNSMREITARGNSLNESNASQLSSSGDTVLVIHGEAIDGILKDENLKKKFEEVSTKCKSVICARVTPSQKARITRFVRGMGKMTLAIGDGGNDVAMIQEAHVGVGIMGKEGQQAARAADFAISQFQYLSTLVFVHGHLSYRRTCYVVQYSFYKSMLISSIQLFFNAANTYVSGVSFWNSFSLTMWNGCYTLPQTLFYCLDAVAPRQTLKDFPSLFRLAQSGYGQTPMIFFGFILRGIVQAGTTLGLVSILFGRTWAAEADGNTESTDVQSTSAYSAFMLLQLFTVVLESHSITWINLCGLLGMPLVYFLFTLVYSNVPTLEYYGVFQRTVTNGVFVTVMLITSILFLPHLLINAVRVNFFPDAVDVFRRTEVQEVRRMQKNILLHRLSSPKLTGLQKAKLHLQRWAAGWVNLDLSREGAPQVADQTLAVDP